MPAPGAGTALLDRLGRGDIPATLYVDGPCAPLVAALLAELRAAWAATVPESPIGRVLRTAESSVEEMLAVYQGASLFSSRELAIVLEVEDLGRSEKRVAALAAGLAISAGGSTLVLVESEADEPRKTLEPLRAACAVRFTALPPGRAELIAWGTRRLKRLELEAEPGVLERVAEACEGETLAFFNELDKLCAFADAGRVTLADTATVLRPVVGAELVDFLGAVALGYPGLAAQKLSRLLAAGVGEGELMFALTNLVGGALGGWARHREHSLALGRRRRPRELSRMLDALYRAESAWKSGRADVVAVLEQTTRTLSG